MNRRLGALYFAIFTAILLPTRVLCQVKPYNGGLQTRSLITQPVDDTKLVALSGNTRSAANAANDRGAVPDGFPIEHMLLQLQRPPELEQELVNLIDKMHKPGAPEFHQWLTPDQLGQRFGLSGQDMRTITGWLVSHGFQVNAVHPTGLVVDFSGNAAQVRSAFHTEIHNLNVNGEPHISNMQDPQIPAALAGAVKGVVSLHNFMPHSSFKKRPAFDATISGSVYQAVAPGDLATIYNLNPLFAAGLTGVGQTIAVIEDTNLKNASDVATFRSSFGLSGYPGTFSQMQPPGTTTCNNPGVNGNESEAALDAEWSGAAAPGAAIVLASCADTTTTFGGLIALENMVNAGSPPAVMSISYGECEAENGVAANASYVQAYQLAVAQGVSVFVSSGDEGAASCDADLATASHGIAVSGFASTPYNVAVGGTDFSDRYSGTVNTYWNSTNTPTYESAISYIPEIPWNDACTSQLIFLIEGYSQGYGSTGFCNTSTGRNFLTTASGSGGPSSYSSQPSWQSVFGLPTASGGPRYLPDVSLFAANGVWGHFYVYCMSDTTEDGSACNYSNSSDILANAAGGTSFASPIMAGIMALVNQKSGSSQGLPNQRLYALAAAEYGTTGSTACNSSLGNKVGSSCFFYDVTLGDMDVPCTGTINCFGYSKAGSTTTYGALSTSNSAFNTAYGTNTGWDFATGIGTVNAYNLVYGWVPASTTTTTTSGLNPSSYGTSVVFTATITSTSQNNQAVGGTVAWSANTSCGTTPVTAGTSGLATCTTSVLPGGSDTVTATYSGDITHTGSNGSVTQQVNKIAPTVTFTGAPASAAYNSTFTVSSTTNASTTASTVASGACSISGNTVTMTSGTGTCSLTATWAADSDYNAATATQSTTATKAAPTVTFTGAPASAAYNSTFTVSSTTNASTTASIVASGACSISGNTVTVTSGTGTCSLTATWAADNNYNAATATQSTTATKAAPTVTFTGAPASAAYNSTFTVSSTTNASTTASIVASGACSISGNTVTMTSGTGTCSLTATWAADNNYNAATATQSTTASKIAPTVTFTGAPASAAYNSTFTVSSTTNASTTASTVASGACSISGNTVTMTSGAGTCSLTATWAADNNYNAATATQSTTASKIAPTVTFTGAPASAAYNSTFTVSSTTNASTTASIAASGACSISGNTVTMTSGAGTCSLTATWAADSNYNAATATQSTTASKIAPTVTFTGAPASAAYNSTFTVSATTNAGTTASIVAGGACSISGNTVTMTSGTGTCSLTANWAANGNFNAATATQSTTASKIAPTVTFTGAPASAAYNSTFMVSSTTNASTTASIVASGACSISGNIVTMTSGTGTCSLTAAWAADNNYNAATATQSTTATSGVVASSPWPNGYSYQATFTVAAGQVPSAQTNFPALISGTFADFATTASGGRINNACTQTVGTNAITVPCDLIFTSDSAGTMPLSWEFETYNAATGAVNIWVNVPSLSNGTVIYAWYGQPAVTTLQTTPSSTWSGSFEAVYHLSESVSAAATQINDSTANANNGTLNGSVQASQQQPGEIGGSVNFEGNTWAELANAVNFSFERTNSFSISGWFKLASNTVGTLLSKVAAVPAGGWLLQQQNSGGKPAFTVALISGGSSPTNAIGEGTGVSTGAWHYLVATYSGTSTVAGMQIYVDGVSQTVTALSNNLNASILNNLPAAINGRDGPTQETAATMDELRISTAGTVFPAAYVTTSYNNQENPGAFFTVATGLLNSGPALPSVSLSSSSITFPNQTVNTTSSPAQTITVTNSGPGTLAISSIGITGTGMADFAQTNNCPVSPNTIAVNGTCTISVTFTPQTANTFSAAVTITDNGASSPQSVALSGTGTPVPSTVTLSSSSITFPNQTVNTTSSPAQTITVTNSGPSPLTISGIGITGTGMADFAQTNNCPVSPNTIAVNGTCTISVTFTPQTANTFSAAVMITDNGAASPQSVSLSGTGTPVPSTVTLSASSITFPNQTVNTTSSPAQTITVTNSGPSPLTISGIGITGTGMADFAQTNNCPVSPNTIAVNGTCTISVTFTPQTANTFSAAVTITDNGAASPQSVALSGTGTPVPSTVTLSSSSIAFPNQTVNTTSSPAQTITVTNSGPSPLTISGIGITGTGMADFAQTNNCPVSPNTIAVNGTCTISVTFTPQTANSFSAAVMITDNGAASPQSVSLSGTGTPVPSTVTLSASSITFPNQTVNTTSSPAQTITVTNSGPSPLTISGIGITGTGMADFAQTNNCPVSPNTIAVNGTCTISVTFTPLTATTFSAAVTITDNGASSPQSVALSGTGTPVPSTVTLSSSSIAFPNQTVNTTSSPAQTITVTNSGPSPLTISGIGITGTGMADFAQTNNCPVSPNTIAVNGTCTISVTFTPQTANSFSAAVTITDNGAASPQSVGLSGTGTAVVSGGQAWPNGYSYQATFTVAAGQVPSAQTNFPALISGTFADFATTASGGRINNACTQTVGTNAITVPCDLIFTSDAAGTMPLSWEFETYNAATGAVNIWVNVPSLSNGTVIYAWYGQPGVTTLQTTPSSTWSGSFEAVYHLGESVSAAATQINDSTANANNGTLNGSVQASQQQPGEIGGSVDFEGNTWAELANAANFSFERTNSFSISGWFKLASNTVGTLLSKVAAVPAGGWLLQQQNSGGKPAFTVALISGGSSPTNAIGEGTGVSTGAWHYLVATYSGTSTVAGMRIYVDGVSQTLTALSNNLNASILNNLPAAINGRDGPTQETAATMDELRISTAGTVFPVAYVTTSYNNQENPGAFFTVVTGLTN